MANGAAVEGTPEADFTPPTEAVDFNEVVALVTATGVFAPYVGCGCTIDDADDKGSEMDEDGIDNGSSDGAFSNPAKGSSVPA